MGGRAECTLVCRPCETTMPADCATEPETQLTSFSHVCNVSPRCTVTRNRGAPSSGLLFIDDGSDDTAPSPLQRAHETPSGCIASAHTRRLGLGLGLGLGPPSRCAETRVRARTAAAPGCSALQTPCLPAPARCQPPVTSGSERARAHRRHGGCRARTGWAPPGR
jgi:hypothetical protein